jgi:hypothetical protein
MKALTLTQPWATLMALQMKRIETRSWSTSYRGEFVVHAAKGFPKWAKETCEQEPFKHALGEYTAKTLPLSQGLCIVNLLGCFPTTRLGFDQMAFVHGVEPDLTEIAFGDYSENRYMWLTDYVRPLPSTGPVKGALSLWTWNPQQMAEDALGNGDAHL